jgi:phage terminase large subunit GpA-like protein
MVTADYTQQLNEILDAGLFQFSTIKPSEWAEQNRVMDSSVSPFPGPFSFNINPYTREIVDCLSPDHPARIVAIMKGAQIGFSASVIENGVGWIISQNPGNILFLTGHSDLSEEAMTKIDQMIDSCGIRHLIRANVQRAKSMKTGDTNLKKEFPGGSLVAGSATNHKLLRQRSVRYGFIDDFDAAKNQSKESGSTRKMIEQRFAAYYDKMKLLYISTPELKETSNIEPVYLLGDQRKYHIPCPCCGEYISLEWSIPVDGTDGKEMGGITWKVDGSGKLITDSVGYICQKCAGFFTDKNKYELNLLGEWKPTAEPSEQGFYSYHLSSLYAPAGMYDWKHYVNDFLQACPPGQPRKEDLYKAFVNLVLGETYEQQGEAPKANELQKNIRPYEIGIIPEKLSERDGNGRIVLLTCAADLNGTEDDARLDYEIVGWSETGSSYSISHGSIGTFIPRENSMKVKEDRERWSYNHAKSNNVWGKFREIIGEKYRTDTGRNMKIFITGIDCGHYTNHAYAFIDKPNVPGALVVGLKGDKEGKFRKFGVDTSIFRQAKERANLYLVEVNQVKDEIASLIKLQWDRHNDPVQPPGFMNYPTPSAGLYLFNDYFSHYEAEHRVIESKEGEGIAARWVKKTSASQNHFFDVRVYNISLREILVSMVCKAAKITNYSWVDYVDMVLGKTK